MNISHLQSLYHRLLFLLPFAADSNYDYDDPRKWDQDFPTCSGLRQSPMPIYTHRTIPITLPPLIFQLYDNVFADFIELHNNGHTIEFLVPETVIGQKPFITGGFMFGIYTAEQVHFHWGSPNQKGSEHALNGKHYDLEMHIVHKSEKYLNMMEAQQHDDGLSVIAVFFKVVNFDNVYAPGINAIFENLDHLREFNSSVTTSDLTTMGALLGTINREDFISYRGSLTSPPCAESVTWYIFPEIIPISEFEMSKFFNITDYHGRPLINNFRPLQKPNFRKVYRQNSLSLRPDTFVDYTTDNLVTVTEQWGR